MSARHREAAVLAAGVALYMALAVSSMRTTSSTFDEAAHLPAGYTNVRLSDYRLTPEHTPLVRSLAALPLLALDVTFKDDDETWAMHRPWELGKRFLYRWNDGDRLLFWGRVPIVTLGAVVCAAIFLWTRALFGTAPATLALFLAALNPDLLAHGQVVTTDMGAAAFVFLSVAAFERLTRAVTVPRVLAAGLALGAALATKFSGLVLVPVLAILAVVAAVRKEPLEVRIGTPRTIDGAAARARVLAAVLAVMALTSVLVIWAAYRFQFPMTTDPRAAGYDWGRVHTEAPVFEPLILWARAHHLLPEGYLYGFLRFFRHLESPAFLLGERSLDGWWYYFLVTFAVKTPLALVALVAVGVRAGRRAGTPWTVEAFVWVPLLVYLALSLGRGLNIGHRHLLPLYPFLFVIAGRAALLATSPRWRAAVVALAVWAAGAAAFIHPHYLSYFNELAGGPSNGWKILVDSNLDWGQDLKELGRWMDANRVDRARLSYFGTGDPAYYRLRVDLLPGYTMPVPTGIVREVRPGDIVAVSATNLQEVYVDEDVRPLMRRLRALTPIGRAGYSILIYRADFAWP